MTEPVGGPSGPQPTPGIHEWQTQPQSPPYTERTASPASLQPSGSPQLDTLREGLHKGMGRAHRHVDRLLQQLGDASARRQQAGPPPPFRPPAQLGARPPSYSGTPAGSPSSPASALRNVLNFFKSAQQLVQDGGNVDIVAQAKSISEHEERLTLEGISVHGPAGRRAYETGDFDAAAYEFGIRDSRHVAKLKWFAAVGLVDRGEKVATAGQRCQLDEMMQTRLQQYALKRASREVAAMPENYEAVADRYGLTAEDRETLRGHAAVAAVERTSTLGQLPVIDEVARQFGFDVNQLKFMAAEAAALQRSEPIDRIARRLALHTVDVSALEVSVINAFAGAAVARGENVRAVAQQCGITRTVESLLEPRAIEGVAGVALRHAGRMGAPARKIQEIAEYYGIAPTTAFHVAGQAAAEAGYNISAMARAYGISDQRIIGEFARICINGPAALALQRPDTTAEGVAQFFGLTSLESIEQLKAMKRDYIRQQGDTNPAGNS